MYVNKAKMATAHKVYYLTKDSQFWEIRLKGKDTIIRSGKEGKPGRTFKAKEHTTDARALQFALRQVNAKIIQGFTNSHDETPSKAQLTKAKSANKSVVLKKSPSSSGKSARPRPPLKKRETIRRLVQQKTVRATQLDVNKTLNATTTPKEGVVKLPWRKPPKKQSTIRMNLRATQGDVPKPVNNATNAAKEGVVKPSWRKPPKKQSTIRMLARKASALKTARTIQREQVTQQTPIKRAASVKTSSLSQRPPKRQLFDSQGDSLAPPAVSQTQTNKPSTSLDQPKTLGTVTFLQNSPTLTADKLSEKFLDLGAIPKAGISKRLSLSKQDTVQMADSQIRSAGTISRMPSLTIGIDNVYIPPRRDWPLQMSAPVRWGEKSRGDISTYAVHVDDRRCLCGDDTGRVVEFDGEGRVGLVFQLPAAVKCIIKEEDIFYVGCENGSVYDISNGAPRCLYKSPKSSFSEVQGLSLHRGILVTSNVRGQLVAVNHDGKVLWKKRSSGDGGWMLCVDPEHVYHGHSGGVTKYGLKDGSRIWHKSWTCSIFAGVQNESFVYTADNNTVHKIRKDDGKTVQTYELDGSGCIMSVTLGTGLVFAAGSACIICYDEKSAKPIYKFLQGGQPLSMQYRAGRLYCTGVGGLSVMDLSKEAIMAAKQGKSPKKSTLSQSKLSPVVPTLEKVPTLNKQPRGGTMVQCVQDGAAIKVKAVGKEYNKTWSCEFPINLKKKGSKYAVGGLRASDSGGFYRVMGDIQEIL